MYKCAYNFESVLSQFLPPSNSPWADRENLPSGQARGRAHPLCSSGHQCCPLTLTKDCRIPGQLLSSWQMTNVAEHASIKYISGVNDTLRDVKSAIFNKDARTKNTRFNQILCHELKEINPFVFPFQILRWKDHVWSGRMAELLTLYVVYLLCLYILYSIQ